MAKKYYSPEEVVFAEKPKSHRFKDLEGKKFNSLTVLGFHCISGRSTKWFCKCDCGNVISTYSDALRDGKTKSCECLKKERISHLSRTHGLSKTVEYRAFCAAKNRCINKKGEDYHRYGGRGICFEFSSFEEFLLELGERPKGSYSVDRINNEIGYKQGNVRWATYEIQSRNKRSNRIIEIDGRSQVLQDWAREIGITSSAIDFRLKKRWCNQCLLQKRPPTGCCRQK